MILTNSIFAHTDQLKSSNTWVLPCILCETFCFAKVVLIIGIMWLQNIDDITRFFIFSDNDKIRVCTFNFSTHLITNTE